jgi:hypothetical protein
MSTQEFDGFYFLPGDEDDDDLNLAYFRFHDDQKTGLPIESTPLGDKYHIAFFRRDANGDPMFDEEFEAIFADPSTYIKGLLGARLYGCVLRKTENSDKWWNEYLTRAQKTCMMYKLKNACESVLETKQ